MKRLLYLGYYFKELDKARLKKFMAHAKAVTGKSSVAIWADVISSSLKYNISVLDYFHFRFYELNSNDRDTFAGTGFMYEYQLKMNPKKYRDVLENKILFLDKFRDYVIRKWATIDELENDHQKLNLLLQNPSGKIVAKGSMGQVGAEVKVLKCSDYSLQTLLQFMKLNGFDLLEEYVVQHPDIMKLSPSGLNTIRVFTQLDNDNKLHYLGARLRITINSSVDNMAAGNPAAPIDIETGIINGPAMFSDITKSGITTHPVTNVQIQGFKIPYWQETLQMLEKAVLVSHENKSIGWDVAITEKGPELIEGNHNWCKLLWQIPVNKGLKYELTKFKMHA